MAFTYTQFHETVQHLVDEGYTRGELISLADRFGWKGFRTLYPGSGARPSTAGTVGKVLSDYQTAEGLGFDVTKVLGHGRDYVVSEAVPAGQVRDDLRYALTDGAHVYKHLLALLGAVYHGANNFGPAQKNRRASLEEWIRREIEEYLQQHYVATGDDVSDAMNAADKVIDIASRWSRGSLGQWLSRSISTSSWQTEMGPFTDWVEVEAAG